MMEIFTQYGIPNIWAAHYAKIGISVTTFKNTSTKNLVVKYNIPKEQAKFVKNCLTRKPIDRHIVQQLLENSNYVCCICKGAKSDAYIIHHIVEYAITQDNAYSNLAVLCPNDHDLAHRQGLALTNRLTEQQIRQAKVAWEKKVKTDNEKAALVRPGAKKVNNWRALNLFKELQSYTEGDKEYFFGRNEEIEILLTKISRYNIIGLFGESGTGKTSLVNAGLLPYFKMQDFITVSVRCIDEPIKRTRDELFRQIKDKITAEELNELIITDTFPHLILQLKKFIEKNNFKIIIIIDQFEELFTRASEMERANLSKGIVEAISSPSSIGKLFFLLSLREDYLGNLWEWSHLYRLEDAWIHQFRISRFNEKKAQDVIVLPLQQLGIPFDAQFIKRIINDLKNAGDGLIYPPYLQILCSKLIEKYKEVNTDAKPILEFSNYLFEPGDTVESVITDYLSVSMLEGLTEQEQSAAKNILDLLTGPQGLRTFLTVEEISRFLLLSPQDTFHIIEHLVKRKIAHPVMEQDTVIGYELVHDFLSKKFFERLGSDEKKSKTVRDIFRRAFREWKQHEVLASQDRLEILFPAINQLALNKEEWKFLIKSSFSVYWHYNNKWLKAIDENLLADINMELMHDKEERIAENACSALARSGVKKHTPALLSLLAAPQTSVAVKDTILHNLAFYLKDERAIPELRNIARNDREAKLRKNAIYAFGQIIREMAKSDVNILEKEMQLPIEALDDSMTHVRKTAIEVLAYTFVTEKTVQELLKRVAKEDSIVSRKALIYALGLIIRKDDNYYDSIFPVIYKISKSNKEDYRVRQEAIDALTSIADLGENKKTGH